MSTIALHDELTLLKLTNDGPSRFATIWHEDAVVSGKLDWPLTTDLVARAHHLLESTIGRSLPVQATLRKRIPIGGGLGGGSSDAAAMLLGLCQLFDLKIGQMTLMKLAHSLGSDVPFFIEGGHALVEGMGEKISPISHEAEIYAVLAFPPLMCPSGAVYGIFDQLDPTGIEVVDSEKIHQVSSSLDPEKPFNDLAKAAFKGFPELEHYSTQIEEIAERPAHLSGSGSTFFVLCDDPMHADHLAAAMSTRLNIPCLSISSCQGVAMTADSTDNE
jgi:4-diphosphocytidyl-2-C-methyl-D-erythritol kinase